MAAACGLIPLLTLFATPKSKLGPFAKYCYVAAVVFNAAMLTVKVSPFFFPVTAETFNFVSPSKLNRAPDGYGHLTVVLFLFG